MKKILFLMIAIMVQSYVLKSQGGSVHVNREWKDSIGNPVFNPILNQFGVQWSTSVESSYGGIITVGHTNVSGQGENILLSRIDAAGTVLFSFDFNTASANNDYGTSVVEGSGGDIYVCGTTDNGGSSNYDVVVLKYNSSGSLISSTLIAGSSGMNDIGTSIILHPFSGDIYVAACSQRSGTYYDYYVARLDPVNLSVLSSNTYDYASLIDVPLGISTSTTGDVCLIGASASSTLNWDYAVAEFDPTSLAFLSATRDSLPGIGYDQPLAFMKDVSNNIYITGRASSNGINYNIKTVKITPGFSIVWSQIIDGYGLEDAGNSIVIDQSGNVFVGGFLTKSNNVKELIVVKYNSAGSELWRHRQSSKRGTGDALIKALGSGANGNTYYLGSELGVAGNKDVLLGKLSPSGRKSWERNIYSVGSDIIPSDIKINGSTGIYVSAVVDASSDSYLFSRFTEFESDTNRVYSTSGVPIWKKNELIVGFNPSALDSAAIDNKVGSKLAEYGTLRNFMKATAYSTLMSALDESCHDCDIKAIKVFNNLSTTFTSSISRLGETVSIPDFWTTFVLVFPSNISIQQAYTIFGALPNIISYSHPNFMAYFPDAAPASPPASPSSTYDPLYYLQHYLNGSTGYPNATIHANEAWSIVPSGGSQFIRGGVFDSGVDWEHEDFGYDGTDPSTSRIKAGWDFESNSDLKSIPNGGDLVPHGTYVAGIIGAVRNNTLGVKGIAGGNDTLIPTPSKGISLFGIRLGNNSGFFEIPSNNLALNYLSDAIITTALPYDTTKQYQYGLHFSNNSWLIPVGPSFSSPNNWFIDTNITLITEAVHFANRMNVSFVAARGNDGQNSKFYPAVTDDDWVLNVGGAGYDGNYSSGSHSYYQSSWGNNVDVIAPSWYGNICALSPNNSYTGLAGATSCAAPQVSGVVGLLMSYMDTTSGGNSYNNLAPEDCEQIIQRSASVMPNGAALPNDSAGYGRLNAGAALRLVQKPCNKLWHFGTKNFSHVITKTPYSSGDTVRIIDRCVDKNSPANWLEKGKYVIKTYQIDVTVYHSINSSDTIVAFWPRSSMSEVWEVFRNGKLRPRERDTIIACTGTQAHLRGYIYQIKDTTGTIRGWWPCDTSLACPALGSLFEYSILTRSCNILNAINENSLSNSYVQLFPNPASNHQSLIIESSKEGKLTIDMYDLMGRCIKTVYKGRVNSDRMSVLNDVSLLPNSLYIYVIRIDDEVIVKKFIKQ